MSKALIAAIAAACLAGAAGTAAAQDLTIPLDRELLESDSGIQKTYDRIERRVNRYCEANGVQTLRQMQMESDCKDEMLARAVETVNDARLSAHYAAVHGETTVVLAQGR